MDPSFCTFDDLKALMNPHSKIEMIKIIRKITGQGLKDSKAYVDNIWHPFVMAKAPNIVPNPDPVNLTADEITTLIDRVEKVEETLNRLEQYVDEVRHERSKTLAIGLLT